jgi:two-component system, OmpR family, response regulator
MTVESPPVLPSADGMADASATNHQRVLVVEDEPGIVDLLPIGLRFVGFDVRTAGSGAEALAAAEAFGPELLLLDVMLPDTTGFELCRQIRRDHEDMGVVFLTARNRTEDAVAGLAIGGDDYINKPFALDEVVARVRAVLRRRGAGGVRNWRVDSGRDHGVLRFADLELDEIRHEVHRGSNFIDLSPTEFALLRYLLSNGAQVVSKAQILAHVWNYDFAGCSQVVETYISYLRKKVDCFDPPLIHTIRGVGYCLRDRQAAAR